MVCFFLTIFSLTTFQGEAEEVGMGGREGEGKSDRQTKRNRQNQVDNQRDRETNTYYRF